MNSACAASNETPGFRRPKGVTPTPSPRVVRSTSSWRGTQICSATGNLKPSGITPTTVVGWALTRSVRPTMAGSPLKRVCQTS